MRKFFVLLIICSAFSSSLFANEVRDSLWNRGVSCYSQGSYVDALNSFKELEELGYNSPLLYYNIGNSFFKQSGFLAHSILYYEKALKLDPSFEDARANLEIAHQFTIDRIDVIPEFIIEQWAKDFRNLFRSDTWAYLAIFFFVLVTLFLLIFRYGKRLVGRKIAFILSILFFVCGLVSIDFSFWIRTDAIKEDTAIVMNPVSSVKSSPNDFGKSLLIIHEGTKVKILDRLGDWSKVELSDGRQGWVINQDFEVI